MSISALPQNATPAVTAIKANVAARAADGDYKTKGIGHEIKDADGDYKPTVTPKAGTAPTASTTLSALSMLNKGG